MKKGLLAFIPLAAIGQGVSSPCKEEKRFKKGDVIISEKDGSMMILDSIIEEEHPLFPIKMKVPYGYISYVPKNEEGDRFFVSETPECGIGTIDGFRLATEEEKSKLLELVKTEAHIFILILKRTNQSTSRLREIYVFFGTQDIKERLV